MWSILWLLAGCQPKEPVDSGECTPADVTWPDPVTTLTRTLVRDPSLDAVMDENPGLPEGLATAEELGLGGYSVGPGESRLLRDDLAPGHGGGSAGKRSLALILHHSDAQIADAESPTRCVAADAAGPTQAALRPQELYALHALDAQIRAANALDEVAPIDFALATGDNADSVQENELRWFMGVWDGTPVDPDSGDDDQQLDADCNDPIAPFQPVGANFPWYAVAGNHDVLVQGNFAPVRFEDDVLGTYAAVGTRDLSEPGGPLAFFSVADPERRLLVDRSDYAAVMLESPAIPGPLGHGFTDSNLTDDTITWVANPVDGVPLRLISVDANPPDIGSQSLTVAERETWLRPQLEDAAADGDLVILTSHYALGWVEMEDGGLLGDWLLDYPNVVLVLSGHSHVNRIAAFGTPGDADGFWQIETSSSNDWPQQARLVELVDNGDGSLSIWTTMYDFEAPVGSMAAEARRLALIDLQSGWRLMEGSGDVSDRNTELVEMLPAGWTGGVGREGVRSEALP